MVLEREMICSSKRRINRKQDTSNPSDTKVLHFERHCLLAFSGSFDKKWMRSEWHTILRYFPLMSLLHVFVGDFVRYLLIRVTFHVNLVRCRLRSFLAQRHALLGESSPAAALHVKTCYTSKQCIRMLLMH